MTAPLFHLPAGALGGVGPGGVLLLDGPEGRHAATVRRLAVGEPLLLADGSGVLAEGVVEGVGRDELTVRVASLRDARPGGPTLVLVQALAKHDRDEAAVETATELGVDEVLAWAAQRSIVQWRGERGARALAKWGTVAAAAAKQSRRATVPSVAGPVDLPALVRRVGGATSAYLLHEEAETPLAGTDLPSEGEVLVIVGPEGGITPDEVAALTAAGARAVRLGPTVLRSSSAGPAALAVILSATRWRHP